MGVPKDDTTVACVRIRLEKRVNVLTGTPQDMSKDAGMVKDFYSSEGMKIVNGGSTSDMAARELGKQIRTDPSTKDGRIPPMSYIEGVDIVTEGVVTLQHVLRLMDIYRKGEFSEEFFDELEKNNGASKITECLIDDCTKVCFFVGGSQKGADTDDELLEYGIPERKILVGRLKEMLEDLGKEVEIRYY